MSTARQRRRGTAAQHATFTGLLAELTIDTTDNRVVVHDGVTPGGHPLAKESEVDGFAPINNPTLTGTPAAPTAAAATNTTQIATTAFVRTEIANLVASSPAALDTLDELAAALGDDPNFATTVTNALAGKAPLANPALTGNPTAPTQSSSDDSTKIATTAFVHDVVGAVSVPSSRRNRLVNPAMQISQENGNTSGTTTGYYVADQWAVHRVTSAGTITGQRVQSVTPKGSKDRARVTITAADASLAAGEYLRLSQNIEGNEVADLMWGAAAAKQVVVRFGFKGPQGTYAVALHNSGAARSYVSTFTISAPQANTDTEQTVIVPGDTSGTWLKDTGIGITLDIVLASGSTFQTTAGAWQSGNFYGTSGVSNGMGTLSSVFEIFDAGFYADPDASGVAPAWEFSSFAADFDMCRRYWEKSYNYSVAPAAVTAVGGESVMSANVNGVCASVKWAPKRAVPTLTVYSSGTGASGQLRNIGGPADQPSVPTSVAETGYIETGGSTADRQYVWQWTADARL